VGVLLERQGEDHLQQLRPGAHQVTI
jgi:hypothetical protein